MKIISVKIQSTYQTELIDIIVYKFLISFSNAIFNSNVYIKSFTLQAKWKDIIIKELENIKEFFYDSYMVLQLSLYELKITFLAYTHEKINLSLWPVYSNY